MDAFRLRLVAVALAVLAVVAVSRAASAQSPSSGRTLVATCANCHGTKAQDAGAIPSIAGRPREVIAGQLRRFRAGAPEATLMHQLAKAYTDEEIEMLAAHFASRRADGGKR
jgi:cytochrome c553